MPTKKSEVRVTINHQQRLYVIDHGDYTTCYGFDNAQDEIERICIELEGRGVPVDVKVPVGTEDYWLALQRVREILHAVCTEQGERAVCALSPQLVGLEGHRVEVVDKYDERRRFIVGKSTGWMPCHLEIKRRDSTGGGQADREYVSVTDLGRVR